MRTPPIEALVKVLGYMQTEELNHYCVSLTENVEGHIYEYVLALLYWMADTYAPGEAQTFALKCISEYEAAVKNI